MNARFQKRKFEERKMKDLKKSGIAKIIRSTMEILINFHYKYKDLKKRIGKLSRRNRQRNCQWKVFRKQKCNNSSLFQTQTERFKEIWGELSRRYTNNFPPFAKLGKRIQRDRKIKGLWICRNNNQTNDRSGTAK